MGLGMPRSLLPLLLALGLAGCASRSANSATSTTAAATQPAPAPPVAQRGEPSHSSSEETSEQLAALNASPVYFTLDSATLSPEGRDALEQLAQALRQRPQAKVTVAGHTCELGTTEYNLALGQRRADIVRTHLVRLGVEPERISVVTYGEELPADSNVPEKNRRAEFSFRGAEQPHAGAL